MEVVVFDTQSILIFYLGEPGADRVEDYLKRVLDKKISGHMNVVNLAELYYVLSRKDKAVAEEKERNLKSYGIKIVDVRASTSLWKRAAEIKAMNPVSLADSFAAATAIDLNGSLVTGGDLDFEKINNLKIHRV